MSKQPPRVYTPTSATHVSSCGQGEECVCRIACKTKQKQKNLKNKNAACIPYMSCFPTITRYVVERLWVQPRTLSVMISSSCLAWTAAQSPAMSIHEPGVYTYIIFCPSSLYFNFFSVVWRRAFKARKVLQLFPSLLLYHTFFRGKRECTNAADVQLYSEP